MSFSDLLQQARSSVNAVFFVPAVYEPPAGGSLDCEAKLLRDRQVVTDNGTFITADVIDVQLYNGFKPKRGGKFTLDANVYEVHQTLKNDGFRMSMVVKKV